MEEEIEKLKTEIKVLNKRISVLEGENVRRTFINRIKVLVKVILICAFIYGVWYGYDYITHYIPDLVKNYYDNLKNN